MGLSSAAREARARAFKAHGTVHSMHGAHCARVIIAARRSQSGSVAFGRRARGERRARITTDGGSASGARGPRCGR